VLEHLSRELRPLLALADNRELIFIDPRGTGFSTPKLVCRQGPKLPESLRRCFEEHSVENDPADFTTAAGARDLVAVQRAFGHAKWDVFATSYGTRLALTLLREAPERVGALVLDSPVPLEVDLIARLGSNAHRGLEAVFSACASQTDCARAFPELRESTYALFDDLGARPHVFPAGTVDRESFVRVVLALLYAPKATAYLPQLLFRAARGDDELFWQLASSSAARDFALGVHLSVQCAEEVPFTSPELVARADEAVPPGLRDVLSGKTYLEDCRSWPVPPAGPGENRAVEARVRALVLGGELDPVTPPEYGRRVFEALAGSSLLRVRGASHGVGVTPCGLRAVAHFLDAPEEPLGVDCFGTPGETTRLAPGEEREVGRSIRFRTAPPSPSELREVLEAL
jgi:pimeloyl-ACP methyl ester carboxylesterase